MAEEPDDGQRTEPPSQRRLDEAREHGQIAVSREVASFMVLAVAAGLLWTAAPWTARGVALAARLFLASPHLIRLDSPPAPLLAELAAALAPAIGLPLLLLFLAPILAAAVQNAILWSAEPLRPKL